MTVVNFYSNRAEITQKYCVNKEKPEKKCHGKCHLEKQLNVTSASENPAEKQSIQPISFWLFGVEILKELRIETFQLNSKKSDDLFVKATANADTSMFVPPDFS